ncbi:hypothetical protein FACS18947_6590 [Bacteroidia bacterium]|nr:hypothetical protein FACS18947_6590 [Bacteroidia bacterium]
MVKVDFEEFRKDNIGMILDFMKKCIRSVDTEHPVIADNIFSMTTLDFAHTRAQDDWTVAEKADIFGIDIYPKFMEKPAPGFFRWQTYASAHSAARSGRFWVSELQSHHSFMFAAPTYVYPQELRLWCWEAISHGAKGLMFWKWEPFNKGSQTFGRGLVDMKGNYTSRALEAESVGRIIAENEKEFADYMPESPKVAILFDRLSDDFVRTLVKSARTSTSLKDSFYLHSIMGLYRCLWEQNIAAKFIMDRDIVENRADSYKAIFVSNHVNMSLELSAGLSRYVEQGGVIIADGKFGEIGNDGLVYESIPGEGLAEFAGFEILDMRPDKLGLELPEAIFGEALKIDGFYERRELQIVDGNTAVWASYSDGLPAIVQTKRGKGDLIYLSTFFWFGYMNTNQGDIKKFMSFLDKRYSLRTNEINDDDLKICALCGDDGQILFVFNYAETDKEASALLNIGSDGEYLVTNLYSKESGAVCAENGKLDLDVSVKAGDVTIYMVKRV